MNIKRRILILGSVIAFSICVSCTKEPISSQLNGRWQVIELLTVDGVKDDDPPESYIFTFNDEGIFGYNTDNNSCGSDYHAGNNGELNTLQGIWCTQVGGDSEVAQNMMIITSQMIYYEIKRNHLTLIGEGEVRLKRTR